MIEFDNVSASYIIKNKKNIVLRDVVLSAENGETVAIIGQSGCGKSTLLKIGAGLISPDSGNVKICGSDLDTKKHVIGFMPQDYGLMPWQSVRDNILLAMKIKHKKINEEYFLSMAKKLGIDDLLDRYPNELSGGQQQRAALARVFLLRPDVLLVDEPFSALDAITREEMQDTFLALWREHHLTTLLVTHFVEEALLLGQKIFVLSALPGHVIFEMMNPCFGNRKMNYSDEYIKLSNKIRELVRKGRDDA